MTSFGDVVVSKVEEDDVLLVVMVVSKNIVALLGSTASAATQVSIQSEHDALPHSKLVSVLPRGDKHISFWCRRRVARDSHGP